MLVISTGDANFDPKTQEYDIMFPEAGLHASKQTELIGELFEKARNKKSIYVFTYSEHILNGARLACMKYGVPENLQFLFHEGTKHAIGIYMTETGNLTAWPRGFFDEQEKVLCAMIKMRHS
jgi:predicted ATPase